MCDDEQQPVIVIDNGSGFTKAGFAGDPMPRSVFHTVVGKHRHPHMFSCYPPGGFREWYAGDEAQKKRGILTLLSPVEHGIVTNWDDMEKIWHHTFYSELRVPPEEHTVLLAEALLNSKEKREKAVEIMFETFQVAAMALAPRPSLTLVASDLTTGVVVDSGHGRSQVVPFHEGRPILEAVTEFELGGLDITDYFMNLMRDANVTFITNALRDYGRQAKEAMCIVAADYELELQRADADPSSVAKTFEKDDYPSLTLGKERFMAPEIMFKPNLVNCNARGIHEIVQDAILKCPEEIRKELWANVVLVGGNSCFPGMPERLQKELNAHELGLGVCKVNAPSDRQNSVWIGGSRLAYSSTFKEQCISKEEYEESGAAMVHSKCPVLTQVHK